MEQVENPEINIQAIHKHSFWLYSVIVGLSVEEALRHVLPHIGEFPNFAEKIVFVEFIRLALFLTLVVRFYLGSVAYFNKTHIRGEAVAEFPNKDYTVDFFFGLIHFSGFLALSLAIDFKQPRWLFMFWLSFILLYDLLWWAGCRKYDTKRVIRFWGVLNGLTFVLCIVFFFIVEKITAKMEVPPDLSVYFCEIAFMIPIFIASYIDLAEIFKANPIVAGWLEQLLNRK